MTDGAGLGRGQRAALAVLHGHEDAVLSAAFSPDGAGGDRARDRTARLWDAAGGRAARRAARPRGGGRLGGVQPGRTQVVTASEDRTARLWDAATRQAAGVLRGHEARSCRRRSARTGRRVVTASSDHSARIWDVASGQRLAVLRGHGGRSSRRRSARTAAGGHRVRGWHGAGLARRRTRMVARAARPRGHGQDGALRPQRPADHHGFLDSTAGLWDSADGRRLQLLQGHKDAVRSAASTGRRARVTASDDGTARIWEIPSGRDSRAESRREDKLRAAEFSPERRDGRRCHVGRHGGTLGPQERSRSGSSRPEGSVRLGGVQSRWPPAADGVLDRTARVFDSESGNELLRLEGTRLNDADSARTAGGS